MHRFFIIYMKKGFVLLVMGTMLASHLSAQFTHWGIRAATGASTYVDDLKTAQPVVGFNVGAFVNYEFLNMRSVLTDRFYLQTGLNFIHRGHRFEEVYQRGTSLSYHYGKVGAWYVQLPILACFRYELPVRTPGRYATAFVGPAVSYGMFGSFFDRRISPYFPQYSMNFDSYVTQPESFRKTFNRIRRFDVNFLFGIGYGTEDYLIELMLDYGFLATSIGEDAIKLLERELLETGQVTPPTNSNDSNGNNDQYADPDKVRVTVPDGNNMSIMLSFTWKIPFIMQN